MLAKNARRWAVAVAVAVVVIAAILVALPLVVRHLAIRRVEAMTGRPVAIADVDLNVFTRSIVFSGVRIASPGEAPALADVPRVEANFRLRPFLRGDVHLDSVALLDPVVHLARQPDGALSVHDVIEHWLARPSGEPVRATLDVLRVERGRIVFADRAIEPTREWVLRRLDVEARDIATVADATGGRLSAKFVAGDAPGQLHVEDLHVRPLRVRASLQLDGLDVAPFNAYFPDDAGVRLAAGRFSPRLVVEYDARGYVHADADSTLRGLVIERPGQDQPFVSVPLMELRAKDLTYTGGTLSIAGVTLAAPEATVLDASAPRPRPIAIRDVRFTFDDARVPAAGPGRLALSAALASGGTIVARGAGEIVPPMSDLAVELRGLDVALARMWLPPDAVALPAKGVVGASMSARYALVSGLTVDGKAWVTDLEIEHAGRAEPIVRDDRIEVTVAHFRADDAGAHLGRITVVASPAIAIGTAGPPLRLPDVRLSAAGGDFPGRTPTRIEAAVTLPGGGLVTAEGEAQLAVPSASVSVVVADADMRVAARYFPPAAPVVIERGRLDARFAVRWRDSLDAGGRVALRELTVRRRGQSTPVVEHAVVEAALTDLVLRDGAMSLGRVDVTGSPTIVDASASPPQRFALRRLALTATGVTWPGRRAMELGGRAEAVDGGTATLTGTLHPTTLSTDLRLAFENVDLTRARSYVPAAVPLVVDRGRARGDVRLSHTRADGTRLDAEGVISDLALTLTAGRTVRVVDERVTFAVDTLRMRDATLTMGEAMIEGSPRVGRGAELGPPFALRVALARFAWPNGAPAEVSVTARPGDGRLAIEGTFAPVTREIRATVRAEQAAIEPFAALLAIDAPMGGRLDARLEGTAQPGSALTVRGELAVADLRIGPEDTAPVRAEAVHLETLALEDHTIVIQRIAIIEPSVFIEREADGSFPLRAMLTPNAEGATATRAEGAATPRTDMPDDARRSATQDSSWRLGIEEIQITDGAVRFLDRTTTPFFSEELTRLAVNVHDLKNRGEQTAGLTVQGIVGGDGALDLRGEIAPFAEPFFLDVSGELRDFSVPRTNPYLQRFLDWIARRGELTTKVHYRIVGHELKATNELFVHRLDVARARDDDRAKRLVGLPLGLVVALLKDASGDIHFTLPVSGELGSPKFSFGDAIRSALSNVLGRLVTSPFRAIGSVFRRDGEVEDVGIDPVTFEPGSAALTPEAAVHLQRVADFLRARPYVGLSLAPVVTEPDLRVLRAQEMTARIQRVQREERLDDFATAARRVWSQSAAGDVPAPADAKGIIAALAEREPPPTEAARRLAERRESVTRTHLVEAAGIQRNRLPGASTLVQPGRDGQGRVEFTLNPAS